MSRPGHVVCSALDRRRDRDGPRRPQRRPTGPSLRVDGGLFRPRTETLTVGSRNSTTLVTGAGKRVDLVRAALDHAGLEEIPVHGVLCFVEADWPLIGGAFATGGVHVLWPRKALEPLSKPVPWTIRGRGRFIAASRRRSRPHDWSSR